VLSVAADGRVRAETAWRVGTGFDRGVEHLRTLVRERRPA
jgi:hypothetical protein